MFEERVIWSSCCENVMAKEDINVIDEDSQISFLLKVVMTVVFIIFLVCHDPARTHLASTSHLWRLE